MLCCENFIVLVVSDDFFIFRIMRVVFNYYRLWSFDYKVFFLDLLRVVNVFI